MVLEGTGKDFGGGGGSVGGEDDQGPTGTGVGAEGLGGGRFDPMPTGGNDKLIEGQKTVGDFLGGL